ncbi:MAG: prephenate dehydrogenase [Chloroflexi bacterium]|nr:prephenate dehydrogenase [Chloroflexota bacterium]MBI3338949.1 prephenate dehydrogenase [Chloroflexota bacterium]
MTIQITILGLGQIGASIGLALKESKSPIHLVGHDKDMGLEKAALTLGAVDDVRKLPEAVRDADVVLLCLPLAEMRATLKYIGPHLKENAVVMDTAPVKSGVLGWTKEFIPQGRFYLGLVPSLNPETFASTETGLNAARPDLFKRTVMVVDAPAGTPLEVEQLAFDVTRLLGAKAMLTDMAESDGLMASVHLLPQLTAAALLDATVDQPGWAEARKLAGRPYAGVTGGLAYYDDPASLRAAALAHRVGAVYALDIMLASLKGLRDDIEKGDEASVAERLDHAFASRKRWLDERTAAEWLKEGGDAIELPDAGAQLRQIFLGSSLIDRKKKKK